MDTPFPTTMTVEVNLEGKLHVYYVGFSKCMPLFRNEDCSVFLDSTDYKHDNCLYLLIDLYFAFSAYSTEFKIILCFSSK